MSAPTVFVIRNQAGLFLTKQLEWIEARDGQTLYRTAHRDEAINTVFEVSSKDIYLRAEAVACPVDAKGQPAVQSADLLPSVAAAQGDPLALDPLPEEAAASEQDAAPEITDDAAGEDASSEPADSESTATS